MRKKKITEMNDSGSRNPNIEFVFFGTPNLAAHFLDRLEEKGLTPSIVVTTPDRAKGRGMALASPPVKEWAEARDIPVLQPESLDREFALRLASENWQLFIVIFYGNILSREIFSLPKHGTINTHFSLLPRWKGTSPIRASIMNDDRKMGISLVLMDEKIDHGPIIAQKELRIAKWPPSAREMERIATEESAELLATIAMPWIAGEIEVREQNHDLETYCPALEKKDGLLDLSTYHEPTDRQAYDNLLKIRALDSTIGTHAYFGRGGKKVRVQILEAHIDGERLIIDRVRPEGKREMGYDEFLRSGATPL